MLICLSFVLARRPLKTASQQTHLKTYQSYCCTTSSGKAEGIILHGYVYEYLSEMSH